MGKRSDFPRRPQDDYATPLAALQPLLPHLCRQTPVCEPCPGDGYLSAHLGRAGFTVYPKDGDARTAQYRVWGDQWVFVTNCPWSREILHPIIVNLSNQATTWLLLDAGWMHTVQAIPYLPRLRTIVSVGRVKWIPDSPYTGKDDCCWYCFSTPNEFAGIRFFGRTK